VLRELYNYFGSVFNKSSKSGMGFDDTIGDYSELIHIADNNQLW